MGDGIETDVDAGKTFEEEVGAPTVGATKSVSMKDAVAGMEKHGAEVKSTFGSGVGSSAGAPKNNGISS